MSLNIEMWKSNGTKMDVAADMVAVMEARGLTRKDPKAKKEPVRQHAKARTEVKPKVGNKNS